MSTVCVGAESAGLLEAMRDRVDRDNVRAARLRNRHRMKTQSARSQHHQVVAVRDAALSRLQ